MNSGMLIPPGPVRVLLATKPVDFRKGADDLVALVREQTQHDPFLCLGRDYVAEAA